MLRSCSTSAGLPESGGAVPANAAAEATKHIPKRSAGSCLLTVQRAFSVREPHRSVKIVRQQTARIVTADQSDSQIQLMTCSCGRTYVDLRLWVSKCSRCACRSRPSASLKPSWRVPWTSWPAQMCKKRGESRLGDSAQSCCDSNPAGWFVSRWEAVDPRALSPPAPAPTLSPDSDQAQTLQARSLPPSVEEFQHERA